ncbi:MAG TPA: pseudouridine synthase [Xanthomonadaceae bacterium]|jgi:tRNA pseudouridine65 synthase|nr:pseudouridine synthase [Xanthomonadaceae bacterium]
MTDDTMPVLYADDVCAVIAKPAGLMAHASPMARGEDDFLVDRLRTQFARNVVLVHRLDRATSGCVLIAFDREIAAALGARFMERDVDKTYLAVCRGWPDETGTIDHPLDGGPGKPLKKHAVTTYRRLATVELEQASEHFPTSRYALLECRPQTGRWRQIRRHLKHVSHHLIGDTSHGDGRHNRAFRMRGVHRMLLHAHTLGFVHPQTGMRIEAAAPLDPEFERALALCGWSEPMQSGSGS